MRSRWRWPLEVAYKLGRINAVVEARALQFGEVKLDTVRLAELMQQATTSVRRFSQIRSSLTKASNTFLRLPMLFRTRRRTRRERLSFWRPLPDVRKR